MCPAAYLGRHRPRPPGGSEPTRGFRRPFGLTGTGQPMRCARAPAEPGEATCAVHRSPRSVAAEEGIPELRLPPRSAGRRAVIHAGYASLAAWRTLLRVRRTVSRSEYLCIATLRAIIRFCRRQGRPVCRSTGSSARSACRTGAVTLTAKPIAGHSAEGKRRELRPGRSRCRRCPRSESRARPEMDAIPPIIQRAAPRQTAMPERRGGVGRVRSGRQGVGGCGCPETPSPHPASR